MADKPLDPKEQQQRAIGDFLRSIEAGTNLPSATRLSDFASALLGQPPIFTPPQPPVIKDRWFKDETIKIDGYTFERCRFDRCKLVTEMATFTFKHCFIAPDCGLFFTGPALKVARLLMHTLRMKHRLTVVAGEEALYAPLNDTAGTFTIE